VTERAPAARLPRRLSTRSPKGEQLRGILEELIESLAPGAALPSERALAERYGVARMTVRGELDRLTTEGLTYRVHGSGTFVASPKVAQATALSSFTEDMRERGLTPGSVVLRQDVAPAGEGVAARLRVKPDAPVVCIERVRTADGEPMALERAHLPAARFAALRDADLESGSLFGALEDGLGVRLAAAEQRVTAVAIGAEEAALLGVPEHAPGFLFSSVGEDERGDVIYCATSLFRGDRYEIRLRQSR
jgi:GntR family transcriptional regulator